MNSIDGVKHIIAVASGKGGVGKSTTSVNLALALQALGHKVGLLDADIYGPSQPIMLGLAGQRPETNEALKKIEPLQAYGIQSISIGYLVDPEQAMAWRGPMASGALQQLLTDTHWQDVEYLIIDMPPGTGDIQLTLAQKVPVTAAVIVTTPQDIALADALKGINLFEKVSIPVLGIIENMSVHICSHCGHQEPIFGHGGGMHLAEKYQVPFLGELPLNIQIREQTDAGKPTVVADPDGAIAQSYLAIAQSIVEKVAVLTEQSDAFPTISISDD